MTEVQICDLIRKDAARMRILEAVSKLGVADWWIGSGFVRNAVWDELFGHGKNTPLNDVDLVYWKPLGSYGLDEDALTDLLLRDEPNPVWDEENGLVQQLSAAVTGYVFEAKNQARMHLWSGKEVERRPYASAAEGIADWVETATTVGVRLNENYEVELFAAHGIDDLVRGIVRPTKKEFTERARERAEKKHWFTVWPALRFEEAV